MATRSRLSGRIVRAQSGIFRVSTEQGVIEALLRGRHRQRREGTDLVALGDFAEVTIMDDGSAMIEEILERKNVLSRRAPGKEREQILVANIDLAVFVFSCAEPDPNFRFLDRLLVSAESQEIPAMICANKIDLVKPADARREFGEYSRLNYPVVYTSALTGKGVSRLRRHLKDKLSVFAGPSGAGKSSLMNAIQPGLGMPTAEVSDATGKGKHTTVFPELHELKHGGYVADTPGLKAFALWDVEPDELDAYFREIRPLVADCAFSDCTHQHEPDCAVIAAVESGAISPERYDSYLRMRAGDDD